MVRQDDAEDIVQEVFANIIERKSSFSSELHMQNFLYLSVRNACLSYLRKNGSRKRYVESFDEDQNMVIEDEIISAEVYRKIVASIDMLPIECRKVFELCYIQGYDNESAANMLNISINTVKAQKARGKKILRERLKDMLSIFAILYGINGLQEKKYISV